jgi:dTDP-4-amino-4,6-dideoxygalactose transaminase
MVRYSVWSQVQSTYVELGLTHGSLKICEKIHREVLILPMGPNLSDVDVIAVCGKLRQAISEL